VYRKASEKVKSETGLGGEVGQKSADNVVYIAIFENEKMSVTIEYIPLAGGAIEIISCDVSMKPVSEWQEREQSRRKSFKVNANFKHEHACYNSF
jgi:hypothetical protein